MLYLILSEALDDLIQSFLVVFIIIALLFHLVFPVFTDETILDLFKKK
jgi:hypothetical protein